MRNSAITRRQCLGGLLTAWIPAALAGQSSRKTISLSNRALEFRMVSQQDKIVSRELTNKLANETFRLPGTDFELEFDDGVVGDATAFSTEISRRTQTQLELLYRRAAGALSGCEVRVQYELPEKAAYLRKRIAVRRTEGAGGRVLRADLENWRGVQQPWRSMAHTDQLRYGSHPIHCDTLWAGVEFVAAFNEFGVDGFVLRSRPGGPQIDKNWHELNSTVVGCSEPLRVRDAFYTYIDNIRLAPPRLVACYNTWWTYYAKELNEEKFRVLAEELKQKLFNNHGVFFDIVTADEGWADRESIWQIDRTKFPHGFDTVRAVIESAGGRMGLWISPSAVYPNSLDYKWANQHGYLVLEHQFRPQQRRPGLSLADPKYRREVRRQLRHLIRDNNLEQVKYDGFIAVESQAHDDLLPGKDSVEPLARHALSLMETSREADPDIVTEPTYLNSHVSYISPWIIKYANAVWGNAGGDCPRGVGPPAPDYREAHTTSREYFIFSSLEEVWLPQNALQYFDIVHADEDAGFPNHAAMAFGRGRLFVPTYVNPRFMSDEDWRIYAGLLRWARKNTIILQNTHVMPSRVELGEPYVYAHWDGLRGILVVRNPSNVTTQFAVDLARARAPLGLADGVCYTQYPYRKGIASGLRAESKIRLRLAPWELLFLEVTPRSQLSEPVAVGARWYRDFKGAMLIAPEPEVDAIRVYKPRAGEEVIRVTPRVKKSFKGELRAFSARRLPEAEWLKQHGTKAPTVSFEAECTVSVPSGGKGQILLVLQFPGRGHRANTCRALVNRRDVTLRESSSVGRIGTLPGAGTPWSDVLPHVSEWHWYICSVEPGASTVRFSGAVADPECKFGLWAWLDEDVSQVASGVAIECSEAEMPQYREHFRRTGICLRQPA
jgi:hypothetical protein